MVPIRTQSTLRRSPAIASLSCRRSGCNRRFRKACMSMPGTGGECGHENRDHALDIGAGVLEGDVGPQPRNAIFPKGTDERNGTVRLQRQQHVGVLPKEAEGLWKHTDDFMWQAIHSHASTENIGSTKPALPVAVGKNDGPGAAGLVVRRSEDAARLRIHTKHREKLERGFEGPDLLGCAAAGNRRGIRRPERHRIERSVVIPVGEVDRRRRRQSGCACVLHPMRQRNQTLRLGIRQRLDQDAIHHAEDGAGRSDSDGEHQDRGQGKCGGAAQRAECLPEHSTFLLPRCLVQPCTPGARLPRTD